MRLLQEQKWRHHIGMAQDPGKWAALGEAAQCCTALPWLSSFWHHRSPLCMVPCRNESAFSDNVGASGLAGNGHSQGRIVEEAALISASAKSGWLQTAFAVGCRKICFLSLLILLFILQTPNLYLVSFCFSALFHHVEQGCPARGLQAESGLYVWSQKSENWADTACTNAIPSFFSRKICAWRGSICCPAVFFLSTSFSHMPKELRCMLHIPVLVLKETGEGGWNTRKLLNRKVDIADICTMYFWPQQPLSMDGLCRLLISYAIGTERLEQT